MGHSFKTHFGEHFISILYFLDRTFALAVLLLESIFVGQQFDQQQNQLPNLDCK